MLPVDKPPFGMKIDLLSTVLRMVLNIWISFTVPVNPCASMKSPTLYGFKSRISTPPAKFCNVPLSAIPIATPADANNAMKELVSIPSIEITIIIRMNSRVTLSALSMNIDRDLSTCRRIIRLFMLLYILLMISLPR